MATEKEELGAQAQKPETQPEQTVEQSAKDRYRQRYATANPDINLDDEDALYGRANENLDELESLRESNRILAEAMDKTPELAGIVLAAKNGKNPFAWLVENIGPDMDIRELVANPEFANQMGESLRTWMNNLEAKKARDKKIGENIVKSLQTLKDIQQERNLPDEEMLKMANDFLGEFDEDGNPVGKASFVQNASEGIITKGMWEALINARHYDDDIKAAGEKAAAKALNSRIQNGLKKSDAGVPSLSGGGPGDGEKKPERKRGGFKDWGEDL